MTELTPEARVWVAPDAYDNPTLWTDGPTPDFPRALLVRVSSNADLFDWIVGSLDALAAEKAAREAAEARADKAEAHTNHQRARFAWHRVDLGESVRAAEARVAELEADRASAERFMEQAEAQVAALIGAAQHPHKGPHDTDASMLREAAKRLRGGYEPGGSNTKQTVANVCDAVAELLARVDAPKPDEPVSIYDPSLYGDRKPDDEKGQARA